MANIVGINTIVNGPRNLVLNVNIEGDGSADETITLCDAALEGVDTFRLDSVQGRIDGFDVDLQWGGPTPVPILTIQEDADVLLDFCKSPLTNPRVANYTGDVEMVTSGLGAGEKGTLTFHFVKKP